MSPNPTMGLGSSSVAFSKRLAFKFPAKRAT